MTLKQFQSAGAPVNTFARNVRLLYVEDEDVNWEVTLLHLRKRYIVERAKNAKEAFTMLRTQQFHAILMDIQLSNSDMDGTGITQVLRGTWKKFIPDYAKGVTSSLPIIFMTAYSARYSRDDLIAFGADELVTKPVDFTHLGLCLSRCLLKSINVK